MSIFAVLEEAWRIARTHKSLWLFGLIAAFTFNFGGGGGGGGDGPPIPVPTPAAPAPGLAAALVLLGLAILAGFVILKFVSTGALIEGVKRARSNASMTVREGFREGWAHWGVLLRVALLFLVANAASMALIFGACALVIRAAGGSGLLIAGIGAVVIAAPVLVTLYIWQAFAERIAVLENRSALDAIRKARLFIHGRLPQGLKLVVAGFVGAVVVLAMGVGVIAPVALLLVVMASLWGVLPSIGIGVLTVLPAALAVMALVGILTSSVWTIGYLKQVEQ